MSDYMITGTCRYCGQTQTYPSSVPIEASDADFYITDHCMCERALTIRERDYLGEKVEELLNKDDRLGFEAVDVGTVSAVVCAAVAVLDGLLYAAQMTLPCGDIVKLKRNIQDHVQITREFKRTKRA